MKKVLLFSLVFVFLICFFCSCSDKKPEQRQTYYDVIERDNPEEIKNASVEAIDKSDILFELASAYTYAWKDYQEGNKSLNEIVKVRQPLIDFLVSEGFSADIFSGSAEEIDVKIDEVRDELFDEYIAISVAASEIMKQESIDKLIEKPNE